MKKWICLLAALALSVGCASCALTEPAREMVSQTTTQAEPGAPQAVPTAEQPQQPESPWKKMYREYLSSYLRQNPQEDDSLGASFGLFYIDSDAIPELVLSKGWFHAASATLVTVYDGTLREFEDMGSYGGFQFEEKTGTIVEGYGGSGVTGYTVRHLNAGKLEEVWRASEIYVDYNSEELRYESNDEDVSEEEYNRLREKYVPSQLDMIDPGTLRMPKLTAQNIDLYFTALDENSYRTIRSIDNVITLRGSVSEETDYDNNSFRLLTPDTPVVLQFENMSTPVLVCTAHLEGTPTQTEGAFSGEIECRDDTVILHIK